MKSISALSKQRRGYVSHIEGYIAAQRAGSPDAGQQSMTHLLRVICIPSQLGLQGAGESALLRILAGVDKD